MMEKDAQQAQEAISRKMGRASRSIPTQPSGCQRWLLFPLTMGLQPFNKIFGRLHRRAVLLDEFMTLRTAISVSPTTIDVSNVSER